MKMAFTEVNLAILSQIYQRSFYQLLIRNMHVPDAHLLL